MLVSKNLFPTVTYAIVLSPKLFLSTGNLFSSSSIVVNEWILSVFNLALLW